MRAPALVVFLLVLTARASLLQHWTFDNNTGLETFSAVGSSSAVFPHRAWFEPGVFGQAAKFSCAEVTGLSSGQDNFLQLPSTNAFSYPTLDLTVSAWINPETFQSTGSTYGLSIVDINWAYSGIANRNGGFILSLSSPGGIVRSRMRTTSQGGSAQDFHATNEPVALGQWTFVAVTRQISGGTSLFKTYLNGELNATATNTNVASVDYSYSTTYDDDSVRIGGWQRNGLQDDRTHRAKQCFTGRIDDVRIYDSALTAEQVRTMYQDGTEAIQQAQALSCASISPASEAGMAEWCASRS